MARLATSTALATVVGTRVRPGEPAQRDTLPALYYDTDSNERGHRVGTSGGSANGVGSTRITLTVLAYSRSDCEAAKQAIEDVLDGWRDTTKTPPVIRASQRDDDSGVRGVEPGTDRLIYYVSVDYSVRHRFTPALT